MLAYNNIKTSDQLAPNFVVCLFFFCVNINQEMTLRKNNEELREKVMEVKLFFWHEDAAGPV